MSSNREADLSRPYEEAIGPTSPVQRALKLLQSLIRDAPMPKAGTDAARSAAALLGTHWLHCTNGAGTLNGSGYHSAAVALFRSIEDALDCFAAVALIKGAAERWQAGNLKPSDAAKLWAGQVPGVVHESVSSLDDYRRILRSQFNEYSHCPPPLAEWNLYFQPTSGSHGTLELNLIPLVINSNVHRIDAHLTASLWEFIDVVERAFVSYLADHPTMKDELHVLMEEILPILDRHKEHGCFEVLGAAELKRLK